MYITLKRVRYLHSFRTFVQECVSFSGILPIAMLLLHLGKWIFNARVKTWILWLFFREIYPQKCDFHVCTVGSDSIKNLFKYEKWFIFTTEWSSHVRESENIFMLWWKWNGTFVAFFDSLWASRQLPLKKYQNRL